MTRSTRGNYLLALLLPPGNAQPVGLLLCVAYALFLGGCAPRTERDGQTNKTERKALYAANCASCHGEDGRNDRQGANPAMRLTDANTLPENQWNSVVQNGRGEMPAFHNRLSSQELQALHDYTQRITRKITDNK